MLKIWFSKMKCTSWEVTIPIKKWLNKVEKLNSNWEIIRRLWTTSLIQKLTKICSKRAVYIFWILIVELDWLNGVFKSAKKRKRGVFKLNTGLVQWLYLVALQVYICNRVGIKRCDSFWIPYGLFYVRLRIFLYIE